MNKTARALEEGGFQSTPAMLLRRAYLTTHRAFDSLFVRRGMTADQFVLLMTLSEEEGINQRELARKISSDPNTITAMLRLLEGRGYLRRKDRPGDGRARSVYLTAAGRRRLGALVRSSGKLHGVLAKCFVAEGGGTVLETLARVATVMAAAWGSQSGRTGAK